MFSRLPLRKALSSTSAVLQPRLTPLVTARHKRYEAFDAGLDQDALAEARKWYESLDTSQFPRGNTTYARSSGPGGQHVNKYTPCHLLEPTTGTVSLNSGWQNRDQSHHGLPRT